jgi:hypothetical protein
MAICAYSKYDLIENVFASRPEDFLKYGIYTCRFYVDGDWVEVITDTNIPCKKNNATGLFTPIYGNSDNPDELWLAFVEKAFAKAMGSYEEIPNIKIQKALLHLTGGSVQHVSLRDEVSKNDIISDSTAWTEFKKRFENDTLILIYPIEKKINDNDNNNNEDINIYDPDSLKNNNNNKNSNQQQNNAQQQHNYFIPDMLYSVVACREVSGYELVLMHNPWKNSLYNWTGDWSDSSPDWDLFPSILNEFEKDTKIPWTRKNPIGYFWISFRNLVKFFNKSYYCKLFPNDKYSFYCVRGECKDRHSGGPLVTVKDMESVLKAAAVSKSNALQKVFLFILFYFFY